MIIMSASHINKSYGTDVILDDVSFSVDKGDRIGIVGPNGQGKTTLLSILAGDLSASSGERYVRSDVTVGYLKQRGNFLSEGSVLAEAEKSVKKFRLMESELAELEEKIKDSGRSDFEKCLERYTSLMEKYRDEGGYTYKSELHAILSSMGFDEGYYNKKISTLSGGERTRLALACILMMKPDVLMLDEPTNHLDLSMLEWLEQYLKAYKGTIILVSHDRYFLDKIVTRVFDVRSKELTAYKGNYSEYVIKREARLEIAEREYEKQQKEIEKQEELIRRFKQHNTEKLVKRAQSREKKLERMDRLDKPVSVNTKIKINFAADYKSGNDVILSDNIRKSYGKRLIFEKVSLDIKRGERICIIGDNGVGKTTLLRVLIGEEAPDDGYLRIGHNVNFGYYDQGQLLLDENETVLGEMRNTYRLISDTEMRSILGRFLFRGDDVFKEIRALSGGEKAKLSLLKLMLSGANTLVLDEPTNHLDIESREAVEAALSEFEGTIIMVSHDRYLLDKFPDRILELGRHGVTEYKGKFDYYLEKKAGLISDGAEAAAAAEKEMPQELSPEEERRLRKEREAEERRRARELEAAESRITELEEKIYFLETEMCAEENLSDVLLLRSLSDELEDTKLELNDTYSRWLSLQE